MDFAAARQAMIDCQLATNNVISEKVLDAMGKVPREEFLPEIRRSAAYLDEDILIGDGRYLMEPMILARMIQALEPQSHEAVLDVGGGSGYSAAVFSYLAETVLCAEPNDSLREYAVREWRKLDLCNIADLSGSFDDSVPAHAPYDMILINGAVESVPILFAEALKPGSGRMVCVLRRDMRGNGQATLVTKNASGQISLFALFDASIPYLQEYTPQERFAF